MKIKSINIAVSEFYFSQYLLGERYTLNDDYDIIRKELVDIFSNVNNGGNSKYLIDLKFGIALKEYFDSKEWFNLRLASDIGFWRFLSVCVIPDIVSKRWEDNNEDHFWKKSSRIWLRSIWWFAYLGWNNSKKETYNLLSKPMFDTDVILNTVERTGRKGTNIETYKYILKIYGCTDYNKIVAFGNRSKKSDSLFRSVMRLNTAKILVMEPALCRGGIKGYVDKLFMDLGV